MLGLGSGPARKRQADDVDSAQPTSRRHLSVVAQEKGKAARFKFHEGVLSDHKNLVPAAILLAGYIMHKFETKGGARFGISISAAAKHFGVPRKTMQRGCAALVARGHLQRCDTQRINAKGAFNPKARFAFGNGPPGGTASIRTQGTASGRTQLLPVKSL
jgi:hypothetical protein